jgi:hypothetical protein
VDDLARSLWFPIDTALPTTTGQSCTELAWLAVNGQAPAGPSSHLYFNHRYYITNTTKLYPEKEIFVVRTETLWHDMNGIEKMLGGGNIAINEWSKKVNAGNKHKPEGKLSRKGAQILCCSMTDEIEIYIDLLKRAVNLNQNDKNLSLNQLLNRCGVKSFPELDTLCASAAPERYRASMELQWRPDQNESSLARRDVKT